MVQCVQRRLIYESCAVSKRCVPRDLVRREDDLLAINVIPANTLASSYVWVLLSAVRWRAFLPPHLAAPLSTEHAGSGRVVCCDMQRSPIVLDPSFFLLQEY